MECSICYNTFNDIHIVRGGCCSILICRSCALSLPNCPQCRKNYPWNNKLIQDLEWSKITNQELRSQIGNIYILYNNQISNINDLNHTIRSKDYTITKLMNRIDLLSLKLEKIDKNTNNIIELEKVIQKYNLNLN